MRLRKAAGSVSELGVTSLRLRQPPVPVPICRGAPANPNASSCLVYNYYSGVLSPTTCAVPAPPPEFTYDAGGNLTGDGTHTYPWDAENRLQSVDNGTTVSFVYNALGQRVEKSAGGTNTEVAYDALGNTIGFYVYPYFTQDFFMPVAGRQFVKYQDGVTYFLHGNSLGSTGLITDHTATVVQDELYYPWGHQWAVAGAVKYERFASLQQRDPETTSTPSRFACTARCRAAGSAPTLWPAISPIPSPSTATRMC